ncbi:hypothetical protein IFM89_035712 [Coptis chinensis]|uniref:Uncharacterized protein n=1 Tax=Coptis chinensis TaxID=261450 RepID=A0A835IVF4_9MAGN|nr:hypothetical protein IFM89_035712 [Coptis chinensis]
MMNSGESGFDYLLSLLLQSNHQNKLQDNVTMVLYEVLRLYPPAVEIYRHTCKETKVGDISLPPGDWCRLNATDTSYPS